MLIPESDRQYLIEKEMSFDLVSSNKIFGIILEHMQLPSGKYDFTEVKILVLLPNGYPDIPPDMFYVFPHLTLKSTGKPAKNANVIEEFNGVKWQRWSRHLGREHWRPGIDGMHTYIKRIVTALEGA